MRPPARGPALEAALALGAVALFTTAVLWFAGAPPWAAYRELVLGSVGSPAKVAQSLAVWAPLALAAGGLVVTFRIGLWNIGVEGQVVLGAVGATWALRAAVAAEAAWAPGWLALALVAGAALGAGWALLAGLLKTRGGVNEIFAGLGLNFVAQGLVLWLIFGPWRRPGVASMSGTQPFPRELWLPAASWGRVSPTAVALAALALVAAAVLLNRTKVGLCLRAVGQNAASARLFGLEPARWMLLAMGLGGGLAGLAGALQVMAVYYSLIPAISSGYGYLGLLVVMLAGFRLGPVAPIAFFFAALNVGSVQLPLALQIDSSLSGVIQGSLVLAALLVHGWRRTRAPAETR